MDDEELEITPLEPERRGEPGKVSSTPWRLVPNDPRARFTLSATTVLLIALVVLLIVPGGPATIFQALGRAPASTPAPARDSMQDGYVTVENGAPWGTLRIDGHTQNLLALLEGVEPLRLPPGHHTLAYQAAPFPSLRCRISFPIASSDTCPVQVLAPESMGVRVLDLGSSPARLNASQYQAFVRTVEDALVTASSATRVTPGERYLNADGTIATATTPLSAQLIYSLDKQPGYQPIPAWPSYLCTLVCKRHDLIIPSKNQAAWVLVARSHATWQYTRPDGTTFTAPAAPQAVGSDFLLDVLAWWQNGWHAEVNPTDPQRASCAIASTYARIAHAAQTRSTAIETVAAAQDADGCLVEAGVFATNSTSTTDLALYIYRFGVLLAVNDLAHHTTPQLPIASATARQLAARLTPP